MAERKQMDSSECLVSLSNNFFLHLFFFCIINFSVYCVEASYGLLYIKMKYSNPLYFDPLLLFKKIYFIVSLLHMFPYAVTLYCNNENKYNKSYASHYIIILFPHLFRISTCLGWKIPREQSVEIKLHLL